MNPSERQKPLNGEDAFGAGYESWADGEDGEFLAEEDGDLREELAASDHRGGFGEFGGESQGFIERTFREKIVLVGVTLPSAAPEETDASLDELQRLVNTAGADAVARVTQRRPAPDPGTFVGKGKVAEIREIAEEHDADTVVFDDELSPAQQATLEKMLGRTAIDRTAVILDIFAQNAASVEGKTQVEFAQLRYLLPRLRGMGIRLSQQAGGIGTRGPGETKLEVDRRRLERRMHHLERQLEEIRRRRATQAKQRRRSPLQKIAIVGYTNAGKSTLLNQLCGADALVRNRLFATLDATTRRLTLPGGESVLVADTVGFIRKLPHNLVEAFSSTLSVVTDADLLLHVVDSTAADPEQQIEAVRDVLAEIGAGDQPELLVWNKCDRLEAGNRQGSAGTALLGESLLGKSQPSECASGKSMSSKSLPSKPLPSNFLSNQSAVQISAATGAGMEELMNAISSHLWSQYRLAELLVPHSRGDIMASIHRAGQVLEERVEESGIRYQVRLDEASARKLAQFAT